MHRSLLCWLLVFVNLGAADLLATPVVDPEVSRGPMIQRTTRTSSVLVWRTTGAINPVVRYGVGPDALHSEVLAAQITVRLSPDLVEMPALPRLHSAPENTYQYEAPITGLDEDTVFYYGIFDGDSLLEGGTEDHHFRTHPGPASPRPLRFWMTGDFGNGSAAQMLAFTRMNQFIANDGRPLDAFLALGDIAYDDGLDEEFQVKFFGRFAPLLRNTVTWPAMGNHEGRTSNGPLGVGPYFDAFVLPTAGEAGGTPSGTESFYSFDYGPIHFVCLNLSDEDRTPVGPMLSWLVQDLTQNASGWLVVFTHHTPYTEGSHHSDAELDLINYREVVMPILEAHGVDLVLTAHSHIYERSMLIDGAYSTPTSSVGVILDDSDGDPMGEGAYLKSAGNNPHEGTVVVIAGNGRSAFRSGFSPIHRKSVKEVGSVLMDLEGDAMTLRMINTAGTIRDEFQIIKRGVVAPRTPLPDPWNPSGPAIMFAERMSGEAEVHLFARPTTLDSVIHYTLDGTTPTLGSPVYGAPFTVAKTTTVKALSVWRGAQRTSPVSNKVISPSAPVGPTSHFLRIPLLHSEDDAIENNLGLVNLDGPSLGIDNTLSTKFFGVRFRDVRIPSDATVVVSGILFTPAVVRSARAPWTIHSDLSSAIPFRSEIGDLSNRPHSSEMVDWPVLIWPWVEQQIFERHFTPDLSAIIEEVIRRPAWNPGDALGFLFSGTGERIPYSFDGNPDWSPELRLIYDERDPLMVASDAHPALDVVEALDGSRALLVRFLFLDSAPTRGFIYAIEGSPTMAPDSWVTLNTLYNGEFASPKAGFSNLRFQVGRPGGEPFEEQYYIRIRVTAP
ncbi:MAG: metallophosphoesterase [Akkermansiaceae bacterium]